MFPTKTGRDVGMVDGVSDATGSCMEKTTGEKSPGTRRCIPWQCNNPVTQLTFAAFRTHFGYTFTIPTSGNILMRLGSVYWSALLTSTFSEISCLLMHRRFELQHGLWPIIQIFMPGRTYLNIQGLSKRCRTSIISQDSAYSYCQYIFWGHWSRPVHWVNDPWSITMLPLIYSLVT